MKKMLKITGVFFGILVVLAIVLLVAAKLIITPERVRKTVLPLAEKSLHREVSIGDISISLFSGISIENMRVMMRDGKETFISAESLVLRYRVWPLLKRRVVIDEARLEKPEIKIVRNTKGVFNFSDLIEGEKGVHGSRKKASAALAQEKGGGPPIDLLVSRVSVKDGRVVFTDRFVSKEPVSSSINRLEMSAQKISMKNPFPFEIRGRLNQAPVSLVGDAYPAARKVQADVSIKDLKVADYKPYLKDKIPGRISSADFGIEASVEASREQVSSKGIIRAGNVDMVLEALPDAPFKNARFSLKHDFAAEPGSEKIIITRAEIDANGIPLKSSGTVSNYSSNPELDISFNLPETELQKIFAAMPENLVKQKKTEGAVGSVKAEGRVSGIVSEPLHISHTVRLDSLNLDYLAAASAGGRTSKTDNKKNEKRSGKKNRQENGGIGPIDIPVHAEGRIYAEEASFRDMPVKNVIVEYTLINNLLTVNSFSAVMAGGRAKGDASINLGQKNMEYSANLDISSIQARKILSALYPKASWFVAGATGINGRFSGKGVRMEDIKKSLTGSADYQISDGRISGGNTTNELASLLGASKLKTLDFESFKGNLRIDSGRVRIDGDFDGRDLKMKPSGYIGLDGDLNLALNLRLAPDVSTNLSSESFVGRLLADQKGWTMVPVMVSGSFSRPKLTLDRSRIKEQVKEKAAEKVMEKAIQKLFE